MWQTLGDEPLRLRSWDGEYIVYSPFSGQTHRLNTTAGYLIECLIGGPKDMEMICNKLSQHLEADDDETFRGSIVSVLDVLSELALIDNMPEE